MTGEIHHLPVPPPILKKNFWLYVWRVGVPSGGFLHYVGMTGDTGSARAQSAANRVAAHLGFGIANALREYLLREKQIHLEDCRSLDFFGSGPVYPDPAPADYPAVRGKVAALEKHLWIRMEASGYEMLNPRPQTKVSLDEARWNEVRASFQRHCAELR
jgi:hypothetical protein